MTDTPAGECVYSVASCIVPSATSSHFAFRAFCATSAVEVLASMSVLLATRPLPPLESSLPLLWLPNA